MLAMCGCNDATSPPRTFSRLLSSADRIEVTNHWYAFGSSITGAELTGIAQAVASGKKNTFGPPYDWKSPRIWQVEFYRGTNHLAVIRTGYGVFEAAGVEYRDGTGTLLASWKKLEEVLQAHNAKPDAEATIK